MCDGGNVHSICAIRKGAATRWNNIKNVGLCANLAWAAPLRLGVGISKGPVSFVWD